jgi:phenylacetate-CoA ligase
MAESREDLRDRAALADVQNAGLRALVAEILPGNVFYARKFAMAGLDPASVRTPADLERLPFTTKTELLADQEASPPYGSGLTYPVTAYWRLHQTSGTSGRPLRWLDTPQSWSRLLNCWEMIFRLIGLSKGDRLFFPFSFGPFLGFWTAFEAAARSGSFCLPGGGMSSAARLRFLLENKATVVLCTPTYALHLAEVARQEGINLAGSAVRMVIVAGEPGGSIPATRTAIESAWGARLIDHCGLTEVGPTGYECLANPAGLHLLETEYLVEVIEPANGKPVAVGQPGELVLTTLGRWGSPLLRYRTGDLVKVDPRACPCGRPFVRLEGGILGRTDDMIHLRGNNLYPSALESVIRRFREVAEYRIEVDQTGPLAELKVEVEPLAMEQGGELANRVGRAIREELLFRADVTAVAPGSLPRFEMKAQRVKRNLTTETQRHREEVKENHR